jgi:hypothetical protein
MNATSHEMAQRESKPSVGFWRSAARLIINQFNFRKTFIVMGGGEYEQQPPMFRVEEHPIEEYWMTPVVRAALDDARQVSAEANYALAGLEWANKRYDITPSTTHIPGMLDD